MVWFGVVMAINLQTAFISPPVGFSLFYLQSVAPKEVKTIDIHKGALPFMALQFVMLIIVMAFPQTVQVGIRVAQLGTSSVRYEVGIFGDADTTAAKGHFVHVYVDKQSRKPVHLPTRLKTVLEALQ